MHASAASMSRLRRLAVSDRVELRAVRLPDAPELFAAVDASRGSLGRWLPWVDGTRSLSDTRDFIRVSAADHGAGASVQMCIREGGTLVGMVGLGPVDWANRRAWLGYWLAEGARGRGIMTESARALARHAIGELGLNRVDLVCAADNLPSRAVAERLGFELEGTSREAMFVRGRCLDVVTYAALARRWRCGGAGAEAR